VSSLRSPPAERLLRWVIIAIGLFSAIAPVLYGVLLSLRPFSSVTMRPLDLIPTPSEVDFSSYWDALRPTSQGGFGLGQFVLNSAILALGTVVLSLLASVFGAYAAARLRYKGRSVVNSIILAVYLFPGIVLAVPLFVMMSRMGLTGHLVGLLIVYAALTVPVALYMMRNYFIALPESVEEAALMDGCSLPRMLWSIVLPIALPGVVATAIYVFMIAWNEYLFALLFLVQKRDRWTAPLAISQMSDFNVPVTVLLAGSIAVTIPVILAFFFSQRFLMQGSRRGRKND
jgi:multiple sugar transport system permease protein